MVLPTVTPASSIKPKLGKNALTVFLSLGAIAMLVVILALLLVAKSGIIVIPFFSRFYHAPRPVRTLMVQPLTADEFQQLMTSQLLSQVKAGKRPPYTIKLTEAELTGTVQNTVRLTLRDQAWKPIQVQMAVQPSGLEFFGRFVRPWITSTRLGDSAFGRFILQPLHVDLLIRFTATMRDSSVRFDPSYIQIGDYPVPLSLAYQTASLIFKRDLGTFSLAFGDIQLKRFQLFKGWLELTTSAQ